MLKLTTVFLFVVMFITSTMHAQTLPNKLQIKENGTNLKQVFDQETDKIKQESSVIDSKKMEKSERKQTKRNNWSRTKTVFLLIIIGFAVGIFLAVKYTKRCIRRDPPGCDFTDTTMRCECLEYAQDDDEERRLR